MLRTFPPFIAIFAALLAACGPEPARENGLDNASAERIVVQAPNPAELTNEAVAAAPAQAPGKIPAALHGQWGLTPVDCTGRPEIAKGVIIVSSNSIKLFGGVGTPVANIESSPNSLSADFDFTGNGPARTRFQSLELQGQDLVRTESSPMQSFTYVRCR